MSYICTAYDERASKHHGVVPGVGVSGVFLGDSTEFKFLKFQIANLAVLGYKKTSWEPTFGGL